MVVPKLNMDAIRAGIFDGEPSLPALNGKLVVVVRCLL